MRSFGAEILEFDKSLIKKLTLGVEQGTNNKELEKAFREYPELTHFDEGNGTFFHNAVRRNQIKTAKLLLELGSDVNQGLFLSGFNVTVTPLEAAVSKGLVEMVKFLLQNGATIDDEHRIPLVAVKMMMDSDVAIELIKILGEAGADLHKTYLDQATEEPINALSVAKENEHEEVVEYLEGIGCTMPNGG